MSIIRCHFREGPMNLNTFGIWVKRNLRGGNCTNEIKADLLYCLEYKMLCSKQNTHFAK